MKNTYLLLAELDNFGDPIKEKEIVSVSGPYFDTELVRMRNLVQESYPECKISVQMESTFKKSNDKLYRASFLSRPLFYITSLIGAIGCFRSPFTIDPNMQNAYNEDMFMRYDNKELRILLSFNRSCTAEIAAYIVLELTKYVIADIKIQMLESFFLTPDKTAISGEFAAHAELINLPLHAN